MTISFDDSVRALLDGKNFASVATLGPGGAPQNSVVWFKREGDTVLFSSTDGRQKIRNLRRDPRVSISVYDLANPYTSVEIRGTAEILPDEGKRLPHELSHKYLGIDPSRGEGRRGPCDRPCRARADRRILGVNRIPGVNRSGRLAGRE
ncbi:PPOX class F420-dependent oxidoreductase [Streptomyces sp. GTA36]